MLKLRVLILSLGALGTACASTSEVAPGEDSGELADSVGGALADSASSPFYLINRADVRRCAYPMCGGFFVQRVGRSTTVCANGATQKECRIIEFDYTALPLDQPSRDQFTSYAGKGRALVRGTLTKTAPIGGHTYDKLVLKEAYTPLAASVPMQGKLGDACGSRGLPWECEAGLFCKRQPIDNCGRADAPGTCSTKPADCPKILARVCGCDGTTYNNACEAWAAEASVDHDGPCP